MQLKTKLRNYYLTAIFGVFFAVVGFSYNAWRMEVSEDNNNIRTAAFEMLLVLAEFEQVVYAAHYDQDEENGSPRLGWVKVGLAFDLSMLVGNSVEQKVTVLHSVWQDTWSTMPESREDTDKIVDAISAVREEIKKVLKSLE